MNYEEFHRWSIDKPEEFWGEQAKQIYWHKEKGWSEWKRRFNDDRQWQPGQYAGSGHRTVMSELWRCVPLVKRQFLLLLRY